MKTSIAILGCVLASCGAMPSASDAGQTIAIDESKCTRELLEADGLESSVTMKLDAGRYVVSSTYLRIKPTKEAGALFQDVNGGIGDVLKANTGLIQAVTRVSAACNTARTLSVWRDEAAMFQFVGSQAHSRAISEVSNISRGGSIVTNWTDDGSGFNWATAVMKIKEDTGPFY